MHRSTHLWKGLSARHFSKDAGALKLSSLKELRAYRSAPIDIHPEVETALQENRPVVALESTIITHGMPAGVNLTTAQSLEEIVRQTGCVPATIGIIEGRVKIGLNASELERLATLDRVSPAVKVSRRDIGPTLALRKDGGTTCSATLIFSALAGIKVFATGGLGGVHRGGQDSMDVSADLHELTRCPVGLVSSGVKSILDIGRTLEYLETLGVPVVSYRQDEFPAFYSPRSGFKAPWRVNDSHTAAEVLYSQRQLGMNNGTLFGVPIPASFKPAGDIIQAAVEQAISESERNGMNARGKEVTPWLLKRVGELTQGRSLTSNVALIQNTARVGGEIAFEYTEFMQQERRAEAIISSFQSLALLSKSSKKESSSIHQAPVSEASLEQLVVVGSAAVDIIAQCESTMTPSSTTPGAVSIYLGGVARNVAEAAHRILASQNLPTATVLVSPVGDDTFGRHVVKETLEMGMRTDGLHKKEVPTAVCNLILDGEGSLIGGVADMDITAGNDDKQIMQQIRHNNPRLLALDGNLSGNVIKSIINWCSKNNVPTFFEPTSPSKSTAIFPALVHGLKAPNATRSPIAFASPNLLELQHMYQQARSDPWNLTSHPAWWSVIDALSIGSAFRMHLEQLARCSVSSDNSPDGPKMNFLVEDGVAQMAINLLPFFQHLVIKCGPSGVVVAMRISGEDLRTSPWASEATNIKARCIVVHGIDSKEMVVLKHFPPMLAGGIVSSTGAGDSLVGSLLASLLQKPATFLDPSSLDQAIELAQRAAILSLGSSLAVSPSLGKLK